MRILDRYLGNTVALSTLLVTLVLLALFFFIDFAEQLGDVGKGNYGLAQALQYALLIQARHFYELFPVAALLGTLLGLGWLASNNELIVIRSAGVSLVQITLSVMKLGAVMILAAMAVGELLAPLSEQYAQSQRSIALSDRITLKTNYGFWTRDGQSFINIRTILPGDRLGDISIHEFDKHYNLRVTTHAERAHYENNTWRLEGIVQSYIGDNGVTTRKIESAAWESLLSPDIINLVAIKPDKLSVWDLYRYIGYLRDNRQSAVRYEQAFWGKLVAPVVTAVMMFLAVPFTFGALRTAGMGQRLLIGSMVGIGFHLFNQAFTQAGVVYNLNPLLTAALPALLFFMVAVVLMRRVQ